LLQEIDYLSQFQLGTITTCNIVKSDSGVLHHLNLLLALSKAHCTTVANPSSGVPCPPTQKEETGKQSCWED
jgi:hypothetical protein